jgi:adenylate cyclase
MYLLRYEDQGVAKTFELPEGTTDVGRLPANRLVIADPSVSRRHAVIRVADGRCFVKDAGSRFGTFHNGTQLLAVADEVPFEPGDKLQMGEITLELEQRVPEQELLNEDHEIYEGPGTIFKSASQKRTGEAELIRILSELGRLLLTTRSLPEILNRVVDLAFEAVPAERAFLMMRESADEALSARVLRHRDGSVPAKATLSRQVVRRVMRDQVAILAADAATDPRLGVTDSILRFNIRSFMCAPLWSRDEVNGVLYVDSPKTGLFKEADLDAFTALTNAAALAIEQARLSGQLLEETKRRERLQRYHSPAVVSRILQRENDEGLGAQERDVTVMFCDLVGFTKMCDGMPPAQSATLLNAFLTEMTDVVFEHEGTLDKFLGDALLAVFGAPFDQPDHAVKAVKAALGMRRALEELNARMDGPGLNMRIAINSGVAVTGDIGSPRRREFTVLGDVVNTASRIEDEVAAPGEIVISGLTYERVRDKLDGVTFQPRGSRVLRGRGSALDMFAVE